MQIAVIGASDCADEEYSTARTIGKLVAASGAILVCGGLGGVMEAACRGAREGNGMTVGILPDAGNGNAYLDVIIRTDLGHARNFLVILSADAVIAIGGKYGTLSEIAIALKTGRPVFSVGGWDIPGVIMCRSAEEAATNALSAVRRSPLCRTPPSGGVSL